MSLRSRLILRFGKPELHAVIDAAYKLGQEHARNGKPYAVNLMNDPKTLLSEKSRKR